MGGYCGSISVIQQYPLLSGRSQNESQSHDRLWFGKIVDQTTYKFGRGANTDNIF